MQPVARLQASAPLGYQADRPLRGVAFLLCGVSVFSLQDVIIKLLSATYPVHEVVFFRSAFALGPILLLAHLDGGLAALRTRRPGLHLARGLIVLQTYTLYYLALASLPLAEAVALFFSAPLFITALSVPLVGERVGLRRWLAVVGGFAGVLVILRPAGGAFDAAALLAAGAALTYACAVLLTRRMRATERGPALAFYPTLVFLAASAAIGLGLGDGLAVDGAHPSVRFLARAWTMPEWRDLALLAACGLVAAIGFYSVSQAYRLAEANVVAPFEYVALVWGTVWGYAVWHEVPDALAFAGAGLIVASGLYVVDREARRGRRLATERGVRLRY